MEEKKIDIIWYFVGIVATGLFLVCAGITLLWLLPMGVEKVDAYYNPKQENADERFTIEYGGTLIIYHDIKLNVTCYSTGAGLSCIPDAEMAPKLEKHYLEWDLQQQ